MSTKINVRSPYYIKEYNANLSYAILELFIYSADIGDKPASPQYTIRKSEVNSNNYVVFEIAELVRDYFNNNVTTLNLNNGFWVQADIEIYNSSDAVIDTINHTLISFDGYGYFEDGVNPELSRTLLQSNDVIYRYINDVFGVSVFSEDVVNVSFYYKGNLLYSESIIDTDNSDEKGRYILSNSLGGLQGFVNRVENDGGVLIESVCLDSFYKSYDLYNVDKIYIEDSSGSVQVVDVVNISECKYEPIKIRFINKFGTFQDIWFFKKSSKKLDVSSDDYKVSTIIDNVLVSSVYYNFYDAQNKVYNVIGNETITMNTGFIDEQYNEVIAQLMLSESVWAYIDDEYLPVNVIKKSLDYKTSVNDKLIDYTIDFEFAFNKINDIR